jgi:hypothetical protein
MPILRHKCNTRVIGPEVDLIRSSGGVDAGDCFRAGGFRKGLKVWAFEGLKGAGGWRGGFLG